MTFLHIGLQHIKRLGFNHPAIFNAKSLPNNNNIKGFVGNGIPESKMSNSQIGVDYINYNGLRGFRVVDYMGFSVSADSCMTRWMTDDFEETITYNECSVSLYSYNGVTGAQDQYLVYTNICGNTSGAKVVLTPRPNDVATLIVDELSVYPNPAAEQIKIENPTQIDLGVRLLSIHGQLLADFGKLQQGEHVIPVYEYPVGLYILEITGNGETVYQKIAIAR